MLLKKAVLRAAFLVSVSSIFFNFVANAEAQVEMLPDQELVRVRLDHGLSQVEIRGHGLQVQGESKVAQPVSLPHGEEEILTITRLSTKGQWLWKVVIQRPGSRNEIDTRLIGYPFLTVNGNSIHRGAQPLPNHLLFSGEKTFSLIAGERLRDYLYGVVAKEMPISWPLEALKAQAIAARSYAKAMMREHENRPYQLESSVLDQVYENFGDKNLHDPKMQKVIRAVSETSGMVLLDKKHQVVKAYYHADCGGKTSSSQAVFGTKGLVGGAIDSSCPANPKARWNFRISRDELSKRLKRFFHASEEFLGVNSLKVRVLPQDERIEEVVVKIEDGESRTIKAQEFRNMLGYQELRSTRFQIHQTEDEFVFSGTGFGHGVGLCQWGTRAMANQGAQSHQILSHYYPGLELKAPKDFYSEKSNGDQNEYMFD